jgi:hypothetical protein
VNTTQPTPPIVDAPTLGGIISMTKEQVWKLHREGKIPVIKLGHRRHRYDVAAVLQALNKQSQ